MGERNVRRMRKATKSWWEKDRRRSLAEIQTARDSCSVSVIIEIQKKIMLGNGTRHAGTGSEVNEAGQHVIRFYTTALVNSQIGQLLISFLKQRL